MAGCPGTHCFLFQYVSDSDNICTGVAGSEKGWLTGHKGGLGSPGHSGWQSGGLCTVSCCEGGAKHTTWGGLVCSELFNLEL